MVKTAKPPSRIRSIPAHPHGSDNSVCLSPLEDPSRLFLVSTFFFEGRGRKSPSYRWTQRCGTRFFLRFRGRDGVWSYININCLPVSFRTMDDKKDSRYDFRMDHKDQYGGQGRNCEFLPVVSNSHTNFAQSASVGVPARSDTKSKPLSLPW